MSKVKSNVVKNITAYETKEQRRERLGDPLTMSVPDAGYKYYGLGRNASYEAAKSGQIPSIRVGKRLRVPMTAMIKKLSEAGSNMS